MKAFIVGGVCLALGLATTFTSASLSSAQDVQWRAVKPAQQNGQPITQVSHTASSGSTGIGITLGGPIPFNASTAPPAVSSPAPGTTGVPVIRAKNEGDGPRPLPLGPTLGNGKDNGGKDEGKDKEQKPKDDPKPLPKTDFVPAMPTVISSDPIGDSSYDCCDTGVWGGSWGSARRPSLLSWLSSKVHGWGHDCCPTTCCDSGCTIVGDNCGSCCDPCFSCCDTCCPPRHSCWASGAFLLYGFNQQNVPVLVTSSPVGTPQAQAGVLGAPNTGILYDRQENPIHNGARFNFGFWLPRRDNLGLDFSFFFVGQHRESFNVASNGNPILARPFLNAQTGLEDSQLVAFPGLVTGSVTVDSFGRLWGLDANIREKFWCCPRGHLDLLLGYRHVYLEESISITERLNVINTNGPPTGIIVNDRFRCINQFNGGQVGVAGEFAFLNRWFLGGSAKLAFGNVHQSVNIQGTTTFTPPGGPSVNQVGGLLALPTNIGQFERNRFAFVPEVNLKVGFEINDNWRLWVGYDVLYISNVVRPGDQIDRVVNTSQLPAITGPRPLVGAPRPAVLFRSSEFFAQGISFGVEWRR